MIRRHLLWSSATLTVVLLTAAVVLADRLRNLAPGDALPAFNLPTLDGQTVASDSLRGKAVVLVILSAQQHSSESAATAAHEVAKQLRRDDLTLLFVTADTAETAYFRQQRDTAEVHEPLLLDHDRKLYGDLGVIVLPTTLLIDRDGKLAQILSGYRSDYPHLLNAYTQRVLGMIDDAKLADLLKTEAFNHDQPSDKAARHVAAARLLEDKGLLDDAQNELSKAQELDAQNPEVKLEAAWLYLLRKNDAQAQTVVDEVLQAQPDHRRAKLLRGVILLHRDQLDEAETALKEALVLNPDPVRTRYFLGRLYEKKGDMTQAAENYRQALQRVLGNLPE
ncbi:MAG: redoxin domain-containing protein [Phycisphaeraceae bacterium]|nr:redoxin domain-containing protein [Phycisphaeraceae bacterium]